MTPVPDGSRRLVALLALTLGVFLVTVNVGVVVVALPAIQADLDAPADQAAWVIDAFNLVGASLLLSAGFMADRFGRRRMLCLGYAVFSVGALLCALAPTAGWLIAFRVVQALGGTALTPTSLSIVANLYPQPRERARAIGIWGVAWGSAWALGPIIGGALTDWFGWRWVFVANAGVGLVALAVVLSVVPASRSAVARRLDLRGQVLVMLLLSTLTYALIEAPAYGWTSPRIAGLLALDVVLLIAFVVVERRAREPLVDLHFFADRQFSGAIFITVAVFFAFAGFIYYSTQYLQQVRGYSPLAAGFLTLPASLPTLAGGPLAGHLVGTRGARGVLAAGTSLLGAGLVILAALPVDVALAGLLGGFLVVGLGYALINAPVSTVAVATLPREQAGVAAAVASSARNVGLVLGIAVLSSVVAHRLPGLLADAPSHGAAFTEAIQSAYGVAAAVAFAGALCAVATLRSAPPGEPAAAATVRR